MNANKKSDIDSSREFITMQNPNCNVDYKATFYYDETNNVRKFYLKDNLFNSPFEANFVLGGIVGDANDDEIEMFVSSLKLQNNISEVKFENLAKNDFTRVLKSWRIQLLFEFILKSNLNIHYTTVNFLYWSIVDIIDSGIYGSGDDSLVQFHGILKSSFYDICKLETTDVVGVLKHFKYPNVDEKKFENFVYNINKILSRYAKKSEFKELVPVISRTLNQAAKNGKLPFITDEKNYMLIENFFSFYHNPIMLFKNSKHVFDNEKQIIEIFDGIDKEKYDSENKEFEFVDSKTNRFIQLSDAFVGFIGKMTQFINQRNHIQIVQEIAKFDTEQIKTLQLFFAVYDKAMSTNEGFTNHITSRSDSYIIGQMKNQVQKMDIQYQI